MRHQSSITSQSRTPSRATECEAPTELSSADRREQHKSPSRA